MNKLGEVSNTQHHAHPIVLCDASAIYGGWDEFEDEIVSRTAEIDLGGLASFVVDGGEYGHVDVFLRPDGAIVLMNAESASDEPEPDASDLASKPFVERDNVAFTVLGVLAVTTGKLAIGIAYKPLPPAEDADAEELLIIDVAAHAYKVTCEEGEGAGGWRIELMPQAES